MPTNREFLDQFKDEIKQTDLDPHRANEILSTVTSLYGNLVDDLKATKLAYNTVLLACLHSEKSANRATIKAETSPEYQAFFEAQTTLKYADKISSFLKGYLRMKKEEWFGGGSM